MIKEEVYKYVKIFCTNFVIKLNVMQKNVSNDNLCSIKINLLISFEPLKKS